MQKEDGYGTAWKLPTQHVVGTVACLMENKILIEICYLAY